MKKHNIRQCGNYTDAKSMCALCSGKSQHSGNFVIGQKHQNFFLDQSQTTHSLALFIANATHVDLHRYSQFLWRHNK